MKTKKILKGITIIIVIIVGLLVVGTITIATLFLLADRTNGRIVSSGMERTYLLHVPSSYDPAKPTPLVITMHGFAEWPAHLMQISGWNDLADREGFIVVYPSGTKFPKRWQADGSSMLDVVFISDLIDELEKLYNIDPTRIYANGLSNGAGMSYLLGCEQSKRIAAIGGVSGAYGYPFKQCKPTRAVPMIMFQGDDDPIVPYEGYPEREGYPLPNIPLWAAGRAGINNCVSDSSEILADGAVRGVTYSLCTDGADVVLYTIEGGGHAWPGGEPMAEWLVGHTSQDINVTQMMWDFFTQFTLGD